jgi:hypothetical protein
MALPEYGRNVQKMVRYIKNIEDKDERTRAAKAIIQIMGNLNPNLRDGTDVKHKLWDHLSVIAGFDLDVDSPYPPLKPEQFREKPAPVEYKKGEAKFLHYGRIIEMMVAEAIKMEDENDRNYLITLLANQMKRSSSSWNRGNISDDVIIKDLGELTEGKLVIPADIKLLDIKDLIGPKKKKKQYSKQHNKGSRKKYSGKH